MKGTVIVSGRLTPPDWARAIALSALFILSTLVPQVSWGQPPSREPMVADVVVSGNRNVTTARIMRAIKTRTGAPFSSEVLHADVARLYEMRAFRYVRVYDERTQDGRVVVYFQVNEYPNVIREIIYKNGDVLGQEELEKITGLRKGSPLDPVSNRNAAFRIQDALKGQGRYFANVTLEQGGQATDSRVVFNISPGPTVRVRSIQFKGNDELATSARLKTQVQSKKAFLGIMGGKFTPAMLNADVLKVQSYYRANGYLDVRVTREVKHSNDFRFRGCRLPHQRREEVPRSPSFGGRPQIPR